IMKRVLCTFVLLIGAISAQAPSTSEGKPPQQAPARVFIYQPNRRGFRASPIFCDGLEVASLRHYWTYFVLEVPAGEHSFRGRHKLYELVLELSAGRTYFLSLHQVNSFSEKLVRESADEGRLIAEMVKIGKLHPIDPSEVRDQQRVVLSFEPR